MRKRNPKQSQKHDQKRGRERNRKSSPVPAQTRRNTLARLRALSHLLDSSVRLPVIGYRIGLDPLIGLIPGVGDAVMLLPAGYIVFEAYRLGVPRRTLARMGLNIGVETLFGAVPIFGDVFDATFKANTRNLYLLEQHTGQLGATPLLRPSNRGVVSFVAILLLLGSAAVAFALWVGVWLFRQLLNLL